MKRGPKGKEYLYLVEYGHDKTGKRIKTTVKSFGKISSIPKEELNAIYAQYQQPVQERKLAQKIVHEKSLRELVESVTVDSENKTNFNKVPLLHYGHLILKPIWDKLGLNYKLRYLQNKHTKVEAYSLSKLLFYFVAHKILSPGAYLRAWKDQSTWLCNPIEGVCLDNVYEALDYFDAFSEEIMTHAVKSSYYTNNKGADTLSADGPKMVFFDCTNCYFETDSDDREQFIRRFTQKMREGLAAEGKSSAVIESVLASKQYTEALQLAVEENEDEFLRMRGPSKEGRFSLPIVSVSLVIDERGVPIDFTVFPGNKSEYHQVLPAIERLKEKYHVKDCYFVADRGLNSTLNFDALLKGGFGFIVAQKVTGQSKKQEKIMLSEEGWNKLTFSPEENLSYLNADLASFRYKVCDIVKTKHLTAEETGDKPKTVKVNCKIIYIYDDKRKKRDLYELEQAIAKAGKAVNEKKLMGNPSGSGWRALVKTKKEEAENEDDKEMYQA
ncbi:MAG: transposase, partial [Proteobacteria bacterium]|nr:transposase [Pseudomonadota bacterium]